MIHMGLLNIIRRMHLRQKLSIREISRLTGVSRNTVAKHLAANTIEPKFATPERQSKIDPFCHCAPINRNRAWNLPAISMAVCTLNFNIVPLITILYPLLPDGRICG